jgi:indole-3-glycerol phosphate synthase
LIAAILKKQQAKELTKQAHKIGLQVLMEFHDESELKFLNEYVDVVGVNNRNLKTFEVSLQVSADLAKKIPGEFLKISESGISSLEDILFLKKHGYKGFLIGENFMKTSNPAMSFSSFVDAMNK